jgi:glycosyltransferase involved in cell wall biosynthesis
MLVENLSVPTDRRVWQESLSLRKAGYGVTVVCPMGEERDRKPHEIVDGVEIHRYEPRPSSGGAAGFLREYAHAFSQTRRLVRRVSQSTRFDVVHAANPPDFLLLTALSLRRRGARLVFDHHDLAPEVYLVRFGGRRGLLYWATRLLERLSYALADVAIVTNDSYAAVARERGRMKPGSIFVVRNGPDPAVFRPVEPDDSLRRGKEHLLAYAGMMGPQDGLDHALRALAELRRRRDDWHAVFVGGGDAAAAARALAVELGLADRVEFTGLLPQPELVRILSGATVCLAPEPSNPLNDRSTMIKIAEYLALGKPVVCYDLPEARVSAGDAAVYARIDDSGDLAEAIDVLLSDPRRREAMAAAGRQRVETTLAWKYSEERLLAAYEHVLGRAGKGGSRAAQPEGAPPAGEELRGSELSASR